MKLYKSRIFFVVVALAVLFQLASPTAAYADDEPPATPTEVATEAPPPTEAEPVVAAPTETPAPTVTKETARATETPLAVTEETSQPVMETAPEEGPSLEEVLQDLPEQTNVVVLDEAGNSVSLVTQEAAEIVAEGDPVWCPTGQAPTPGTNGCSPSFGSLSELVANFVPTGNGTIWIEKGAQSGEGVTINGLGNWNAASGYNITLQGGWTGTSAGKISGTSTFSVPIYIDNWTGNITINNITIDTSSTTFWGNGLRLSYSHGNININNSTFKTNHTGAQITDTFGTVSIINSHFDDNDEYGLFLNFDNPNANVTIKNSTFNHNLAGAHIAAGAGADLSLNQVTASYNNKVDIKLIPVGDQFWYSGIVATAKNITVNGGNYSHNSYCGLFVRAANNVIVNGSTMSLNEECAAYAEGSSITIIPPKETLSSDSSLDLSGSYSEFYINCTRKLKYNVTLPNGDRVQITCPAAGKAELWRLDSTTLPADLPIGYNYASAFDLKIWQGAESIPYIREGGRVNISFEIPSQEPGTTYSILYWDNMSWVPLKDFLIDENGNPRVFSLYSDDPRTILSGLRFVQKYGSLRAEVSTNFPGIFVLVQQ